MGNDGGSIPSRGELVKIKTAPKKVVETAAANNDFAWTYCALSGAPLERPLCSDALGRLYNKESILNHLLDPQSSEFSHITSLKDTTELVLATTEEDGKYICPITGRDMNGRTKFVYLVQCGHVMASEALKHSSSSRDCLICSKPFVEGDVIALNPVGEALADLRIRLEGLEKQGLTHSGTPIKKKKRKKVLGDEGDDTKEAGERERKTTKKEQQENVQSDVLKSLFHKRGDKLNDGFLTRGISSRV